MSTAYRFATTYQDKAPTIDRANGILRSITAMTANVEALGHGVQADMQTLHLLAVMGNAEPDGIRGRFGHPGISESATGKKVANARNFQVKGDRLIHDSHLLESARKSPVFSQDPIEYILDMAEKSPRELGESVVINANTVWTLTDGREIPVEVWGPGSYFYPDGDASDVEMKDGRPVNAITPLPVLRPVEFHFLDYVGEPALVRDGLTPMSADAINYLFAGRASEYAQEAFRFVDEYRSRYQIPLSAIPGKVDQLVTEYMAARSGRSTEMARKLKFEDAGETAAPPTTEAQPAEADPVEDNLVASEQIAEDMTEELQAADEQMSNQIAVVAELVENQAAVIAAQGEQIKRLSALVKQFGEATQVLQRNYKRLAGEPVVTQKVPKAVAPALEELSYAHPTPRYAMEAPVHVSERQSDSAGVLPTDSPRLAATKRQMARSKAYRGQGGR